MLTATVDTAGAADRDAEGKMCVHKGGNRDDWRRAQRAGLPRTNVHA